MLRNGSSNKQNLNTKIADVKLFFKVTYSNYLTSLYLKKEFDFVIPKMSLHRKDNLELKERILNMTPEERKKLDQET